MYIIPVQLQTYQALLSGGAKDWPNAGVSSGTWLGGSLLRLGSCASIGSSALVLGCISTPPRDSNSDRPRDSEKPVELSSSRRPMGDHPATLPATIPAIAAAGPNAEFDRDLPKRLEVERRESGVGGAPAAPPYSLPSCSPAGVCGIELAREALRDRGRSVSTGCCSLYTSTLRRPPRNFLRKLNSSLISTKAGFHSICCSASETRTSGGAFRLNQRGTR